MQAVTVSKRGACGESARRTVGDSGLRVVHMIMNVSSSMAGAQYSIAVAKQQQDNVREQGQQALKLIEAATPSPPPGTGQVVNVVA
jgi:hypothetical protein